MESGATLGGTGTVGGIVANSGATVAPGVLGPYARFTVTGEASFAAGSTFAVNVNPAGQNDKLVTSGATTLSGGAVAVDGASGTYLPSTRYTLLTAQGGVSRNLLLAFDERGPRDPGLYRSHAELRRQ